MYLIKLTVHLALLITKKNKMTENKQKSGLVTGLGIGGLVLGIIALIVSFVPCFGIYALFIGIIAAVISIAGIVIASQKSVGKGLLIAGLVVSLVGCGIAYTQYQALKSLSNAVESGELQNAMKELGAELEDEMEDAAKEIQEATEDAIQEAADSIAE